MRTGIPVSEWEKAGVSAVSTAVELLWADRDEGLPDEAVLDARWRELTADG